MPDFAPGTEIGGRYTVVSRLGSGGMADVYLADDGQLGRRVALKMLHRRFAGDPDFVERFTREAQAAAALQHPNIVSVYDRGEWDGTSYIAMEYLPGTTLKDLIRGQAPLDPARAVAIAIQIAQAARFAHQRGIVHRDLKPQNVMVDSEDRAVVTDFGIARAGAAGITEAGSVMGSAHYVSPEQAQGAEVGPASDVYSIGIVLYEMLTGRVPFDAETPVAIAMKHVGEQPAAPGALVAGIPAELDRVVDWALAKSPQARPADAGVLANALEGVAELLRSGDSATVAFSPAAAATAVAGAALVTPPTSSTQVVQPAPADDGTVPPEGGPDAGDGSKRRRWIAAGVAVALVAAGAAAFMLTRPTMVTMPLVVGKDLQTATTIISNAGITASPSVQHVQSTRPKDEVIRQTPLAGDKVPTDREVSIVVSDGPGSAPVPAVVDLTKAEAVKVLQTAGFKPKIVLRADPDTPEGSVVSTDPSAGTNLQRGSEVIVVVSSGVAQVQVPDVVGQNVDDARSALIAAGFVVTTTKQVSKTDAEGTVMSQSPSSGEKAAKGSTVALVVASAAPTPTTVTIPDVIGQTKANAMKTINSAGLNASFSTVVPPATGCTAADDGLAVDQNPAAGGKAAQGTTVEVSICSAP